MPGLPDWQSLKTGKEGNHDQVLLMNAPNGDLKIVREYTCGCIVYRDQSGRDHDERGIFCGHNAWPRHKAALLRGEPEQTTFALFDGGAS